MTINLKTLWPHVMTAAAVLAFVWGIGRPHAQEFIKDTVNERLSQVEKSIESITNEQTLQTLKQAKQDATLDQLKDLSKEQRDDIKTILRALRR